MLPTLVTARLMLRPIVPDDTHRLHALFNHPEVRRFLFDDREVTREITQAVVDQAISHTGRGLGLWIIQADDHVTGCAGLLPTAAVAECEPRLANMVEPIVALHPQHWRMGLATEALHALTAYARDSLRLTRLAGGTDVPNNASQRMLERCGFRFFSEVAGPVYRLITYTLDLPPN